MRLPGIVQAESFRDARIASVSTQLPSGEWVMARPEPFHSFVYRWKCAWLVFTGKADALIWRGQ